MLVCAMFVSIKKWRGLSSSWVDVLRALMRCAAVSSSCYQTSHSRPGFPMAGVIMSRFVWSSVLQIVCLLYGSPDETACQRV